MKLALPLLAIPVIGALIWMAIAPLAQPHATQKHGDVASAIRNCLDNNGPSQIWRMKDDSGQGFKYFLVCEYASGRYGIQVAKWAKDLGRWVEKTAFEKGSGAWSELKAYLTRQGATPYKGPIVP